MSRNFLTYWLNSSIGVLRSLLFQSVERFYQWYVYLRMLRKGLQPCKVFVIFSLLPPCNVICNIAIYADVTTLYSKCDQASDPWQELELASELNLVYKILWTGVRSDFMISMLVKLSWFRLTGLITMVLLI